MENLIGYIVIIALAAIFGVISYWYGWRTMSQEPPGMVAARKSWACVQEKRKEDWLDMMADDVVIEDPIGVSVLDPDGKGHRGKGAVRAFYEKHMEPADIKIDVHESWAVGNESAHLMSIATSYPNGTTTTVRSIFTYRVDDDAGVDDNVHDDDYVGRAPTGLP